MSEKNRLQEYCQKYSLPFPIYKCWPSGRQEKMEWSASVTLIIGKKELTANTIVPCNSKVSAEKQAALMMLDYIRSKGTNSDKLSNLSKLRIASEKMATNKKISDNSDSDSISDSLSDQENFYDSSSSSSDSNIINDDDNKIIIDISELSNEMVTKNHALSKQKNHSIKSKEFVNIYLIDLENKPAFRCKIRDECLYLGFINSIHHSIDKYNTWHKSQTDNILDEITTSNNNKLLYLIEGGTTDLVDHFMTVFSYPIVRYIQDNYLINVHVYIISGDHAGWCTRACLEKVFKWHNMTGIKITNSANIN